jgi:phosphatidylglycerophosphatase A
MVMSRIDREFLFSHPAHFFGLGFGAGLAARAPGTWGTLVGLPVFFLLSELVAEMYWPVVLTMLVGGVWVCGRTGRDLGVHDHGGIVWDEIAAILLVLPFAPPTWWGYALAFALFRLFDIWKPFPIAWCDARLSGGFGVMFDDVLAAGYAVLCLVGLKPWI